MAFPSSAVARRPPLVTEPEDLLSISKDIQMMVLFRGIEMDKEMVFCAKHLVFWRLLLSPPLLANWPFILFGWHQSLMAIKNISSADG